MTLDLSDTKWGWGKASVVVVVVVVLVVVVVVLKIEIRQKLFLCWAKTSQMTRSLDRVFTASSEY